MLAWRIKFVTFKPFLCINSGTLILITPQPPVGMTGDFASSLTNAYGLNILSKAEFINSNLEKVPIRKYQGSAGQALTNGREPVSMPD